MSGGLLYRGMLPDEANQLLPKCGACANTLGVRVYRDDLPKGSKWDIKVEDGLVHPQTGGMSVTCAEVARLPKHRRPRRHGGTSDKLQVYVLNLESLPDGIVARQDIPDWPWHRAIEPSVTCPYSDYEAELHSTKPNWSLLP